MSKIESTVLRDEQGRAVGVEFVGGGETVRLMAADLTPAMHMEAAMHGLRQKIGDAGAMSRNQETGASATIADRMRAMREVRDTVADGAWTRRAEGTGSVGLLVEALIRAGADADAAKAAVAGWTEKEQAAMRDRDPIIAPIVAQIRAERARRAAGATDTTNLLSGLLPKA